MFVWELDPEPQLGIMAPRSRSQSRNKYLRLRNIANFGITDFTQICEKTGLIPRDSDYFPTVTKKNYKNLPHIGPIPS
jgi:hypothetical protein